METKRTRRTFTHEFKKQAAERVIVGKEKATVVAQELGINPVSLYQWIKEFALHSQEPAETARTSSQGSTEAQEQTPENKTPINRELPLPDIQQVANSQSNLDASSAQEAKKESFPESKSSELKTEPVNISEKSTKELQTTNSVEQNLRQTPTTSIKTEPSNMNERQQESEQKPAVQKQPEGFQIKFCTIHPSKEEAIKAGQEAQASRMKAAAISTGSTQAKPVPEPTATPVTPVVPKPQEKTVPAPANVTPTVNKVPEPTVAPRAPEVSPPPVQAKSTTLNLPNRGKKNNQPQDKPDFTSQRSNVEPKKRIPDQNERLTEPAPTNFINDASQASVPAYQPAPEQYQDRNNREQNRDYRQQDYRQQKQKKNKQFGNERFQNRNDNRNENRPEVEEAQPERVVPEKPPRPVPTAAEGRSWKVKGALDQRPNYRDENEKHGYVDEFSVPAKNLNEVWQILSIMQDSVDKRAFNDMVHARQLNLPDEVLEDPKACTVQGPNIPNKPWLRKPRMHQVAEEFFQTTPEYAKAVYENYCGLDIRLDKNSDGTPILSVQTTPLGDRTITIDFSKFDRFVDDFYGDFVKECKEVMMKRNPREYSSLNSFIRIPDEPLWNPKLWAGVRTFVWRPGESLSEAWINYASNQRKNQRYR